MSLTKKTVHGANNPFVLSDFSKVAAKHIDSMIRYNAMVLPLENMKRIFNYKSGNVSVKNVLTKSYGENSAKYLEQYMKDINGSVLTDPRDGFANKTLSLMKKGAITLSLSVVIL